MRAAPLPAAFYARPTIEVARDLIGCLLLRRLGRSLLGGRIIETEAYLPRRDPASHGYRGRTRSNAAMFGPPGISYVYPIHAKWCFNVVTEAVDVPAAVLIRSIEPLFGVAIMARHRHLTGVQGIIANGPARLCQALAIDRRLDHWDLTAGRVLWIQRDETRPATPYAILRTRRVGVTSAKHRKLRFVWQPTA